MTQPTPDTLAPSLPEFDETPDQTQPLGSQAVEASVMGNPESPAQDDPNHAVIPSEHWEAVLTAVNDRYDSLRGFVYSRVGDHDKTDDLLQQVIIKAARGYERFVNIHSGSTNAWLYTIARNLIYDNHRREIAAKGANDPGIFNDAAEIRKAEPYLVSGRDESADAGSTAVEVTSRSELMRRCQALLNPEQFEALWAIGVHGVSNEEFAKATGIPKGTVQSRLFRARQIMRTAIQEDPALLALLVNSPRELENRKPVKSIGSQIRK